MVTDRAAYDLLDQMAVTPLFEGIGRDDLATRFRA